MNDTKLVRISNEAHNQLRELAEKDKRNMKQYLEFLLNYEWLAMQRRELHEKRQDIVEQFERSWQNEPE